MKHNPWFFIMRARFKIIINGDSDFDLFLSIAQFILMHNKLIIPRNISTIKIINIPTNSINTSINKKTKSCAHHEFIQNNIRINTYSQFKD